MNKEIENAYAFSGYCDDLNIPSSWILLNTPNELCPSWKVTQNICNQQVEILTVFIDHPEEENRMFAKAWKDSETPLTKAINPLSRFAVCSDGEFLLKTDNFESVLNCVNRTVLIETSLRRRQNGTI